MIRYKTVFLGSQCNNKCLYCSICHKDTPHPDLNTVMNSLKECKGDNVALYGGEPTLSKDFFAIIDAAKRNGCRRIKIYTNGRALSDTHFLYQVVAAGCKLFEIALWGSTPELHDYLTGTTGSFIETVRGLENLAGLPTDRFVSVRIPICKENYADMENSVVTALNFGINRLVLSIEGPYVSFRSLIPHIRNAINISIFNRTWIVTEGIPFCIMNGLEQHRGEIYHGGDPVYGRIFERHEGCMKCLFQELCPGVVGGYAAQFGNAEFEPVVVNRYVQDIKAFYE